MRQQIIIIIKYFQASFAHTQRKEHTFQDGAAHSSKMVSPLILQNNYVYAKNYIDMVVKIYSVNQVRCILIE